MKKILYIIVIIFTFTVQYSFAKPIFDYSLYKEKDVTKFLDKYVSSFGSNLNINMLTEINKSANLFLEIYNIFMETYISAYEDKDRKQLLKKFEISLKKILAKKDNYVNTHPDILMKTLLMDVFSNIEPHTNLLFDEQLKQLEKSRNPKQFGIGIFFVIDDKKGNLIITKILREEVKKSGLKINDKVIAVNDILFPGNKDITGKDKDKQYQEKINKFFDNWKMPTKENNLLQKFTIERNGIKKDITLKAGEYTISSINSMVINNKYLYINISSFLPADVYEKFEKALKDNNINKLKGLIIDVRDNSGGDLLSTAAIANTLLSNKTFVDAKAIPEVIKKFGDDIILDKVFKIKTTSKVKVNENIPVIVLINGSSASAAEILAGSLALNDRAVLIGQDTFGKWIGQDVKDTLKKDRLFLVTTFGLYLSNDVTFQGDGIAPDIFIKPSNELPLRKEKSLPNYIKLSNTIRKPKLEINEKVCPVMENKITFDDEDNVLGCAKLFLDNQSNIESFKKEITTK